MYMCRILVVGLAYGALFPLLAHLLSNLHAPPPIALALPAAHGLTIAYYAARLGPPGFQASYLGALFSSSIIVNLIAISEVASGRTDLPAFVTTFAYYAEALPAYTAGYIILRRLRLHTAESSETSCQSRQARYCNAIPFLLGFTPAYTVVAVEALPALAGPANIGAHGSEQNLAYLLGFGGLLTAYSVVVALVASKVAQHS